MKRVFPRKYTKQVISNLDDPVVQTAAGKLRGTNTGDGYIFRGVQYARAERFHMPEPVQPWDGIRDAVIYGPVCAEISTMIPKDGFTVPHFWYPQSEHCQYLNLWTPGLDDKKRPVMVWIHGGGFEHGSCVELFAYDGEELSRFGDVVVVNMNHRVHGLGYFDLSAYGEEYRHSGNLGQADLVMCLRWIRENIAAFGGDPDNVMLMGQSGGGSKISTLMQMPCADGLYHKVCIESGISHKYGKEEDPAYAQAYADRVVSLLGLTKETIQEIETIPFHRLAYAFMQAANQHQQEYGERFRYGPVADGEYYLGHPARVGFRPELRHIPLLIGNVLGEFENNVIDPHKYEDGHKNSWSEETLVKRLNRKFGSYAQPIREAFEETYPDRNAADVVFTASASRYGHVGYAKLRADFGSPVYNWLLTLELPADGGSTPWHNADEPFVFHQCEYLESTYIPGVTDRLQDQIAGAWVAFARTGNPNHPLLPRWEPMTSEQVNTMIFDRECTLRCNHDAKLIQLMQDAKFHDTGKDGPLRGYGGSPRHDL